MIDYDQEEGWPQPPSSQDELEAKLAWTKAGLKNTMRNEAALGKGCREVALEDLDNIYTYQKPKPQDIEKYPAIRDAGKNLALMIFSLCPASRERNIALEKIEEVVMWANASIARAKG